MSTGRESDGDGAAAAMGILVAAISAAVWFGFTAGGLVSRPPVKSDRELCEDRGGIYVNQHHSKDLCLSKEAFK